MDHVLAQSKALAATSVATVQALITKLKLVPSRVGRAGPPTRTARPERVWQAPQR